MEAMTEMNHALQKQPLFYINALCILRGNNTCRTEMTP